MEGQQSARFYRHVLFGLVILCFGGAAFAAPPPEARILLNTDRFVVGSKWTLDILVDTPEPLTVRVPVPVLPPALALSEGPYIRETSWEKVAGTLSRATKVSLTLKTLQPGIVEVGPFEVRVGNTVQSLPPVTVYLLAADEAKRRFPVELRWVKPEGVFYEGQAIPLLLQARNLDTLVQAPDLGLAAPPGSLWEKAVGLGEIEITSIGEDRLMNVPWGGWMLIATKAGSLTIPAVRASVAGVERVVPPLTLPIESLPPEAAEGRAVGAFTYSIEAKQGEAAQGGQLVVVQELSGRGNFPYLRLPEVVVPGLTLMSRQEGTRYRAARGGYEGSLLVTWRFASEGPGTISLELPGFKAFQPSTGRVESWDPRVVRVTLDNFAEPAAQTVPEAQILNWAEVQSVRPWGLTQNGWSILLLLPGPVFLAATFLFRGRNKGLLVLTVVGVTLFSASESAPAGFEAALKAQGYEAAEAWGTLAAAHPDEPGLWYNKALVCQDAGRTAEAVHAFLMAIRTGLQGDLAARGLAALEEKELLTNQFPPWTGWPTNLLALSLGLAFNLTFLAWGLQRIFGVGFWLLPLAVFAMGTVAAGFFLGVASAAQKESDAVVGLADGPIRKVPGDLAENWMTLKAGTVVRVQGHSDQWVLVQTGYGLEGWVLSSGLLSLEAAH